MKLRFKVDDQRLTLGDLLDMESGKLSVMVNVMSHCMVDAADSFISDADAMKALRAIPISDLKDAAEQFGAAVEAFKENAIPPTGGGR